MFENKTGAQCGWNKVKRREEEKRVMCGLGEQRFRKWAVLMFLKYVGHEATVRSGHGTIDWFQIGKGVCQNCILSSCLFNLYAEYIWRRKWQPTPVFLPGESWGRRSRVGCCFWGRTELDTTEVT